MTKKLLPGSSINYVDSNLPKIKEEIKILALFKDGGVWKRVKKEVE